MRNIMENKKQKRILWLLNHTTLRDFEVAMLERLGFEVFIPKIVPFDEANQSASVTYDYDKALTIERELLGKLNRFDFYSKPWPKSLEKKINDNFGIAFVPIFPKMVANTVNSFEGLLFLRVFGLAGENTYANIFKKYLTAETVKKIRQENNIWVAAGYDSIIDNEPPWIRRKCIHLPLGLTDLKYEKIGWRGDSNQILFICPRIKSSEYYSKVYKKFKQSFGSMPHVIPGAQSVRVKNDPSVTGFLEKEKYLELFRSSKVLFYHSDEERHLHYHPLEAVKVGLPVVFMADGMLEYLAKKKLPGCCNTVEEAQVKISRVLNGDKKLIKDIVSSQKVLLKEFDPDYVEERWRERFIPVVERYFIRTDVPLKENQESPLTHIGIWMHVNDPRDLTGEGISRLMAMIIRGAQKQRDNNLRIHIALVTWIKQAVIDFLDAEGINTDQVNFEMAGNKPPFFYRFYYWWINRKPRIKKKYPFWQRIERFVKKMMSMVGNKLLTVRTVFGLILTLLIFIIFLPAIIIIGALYLILRFMESFINWLVHILGITPFLSKLKEKYQKTRAGIIEKAPPVFRRMLRAELRQLAERVGKDEKYKAWFFSYPNNKYIDQFSTPKIVAVPDIVYLDFPSLYSRHMPNLIDGFDKCISKTIKSADAVVTFSDYVRENHVIKPGFQPAENVHVIPHAPMDKCEIITTRRDISDYDLHFMAEHIIKSYIGKVAEASSNDLRTYLHNLNLGDIGYLFVSSQTRLHKNHLNLIKAYRILLREKYINQKLVITGKFTDEIEEYIKEERLHLDVLSFNKLPTKVHAAFYACASLTIAPTLFEGGFPFVFSESLSVRTPVILSDIPVVREALTAKECEKYCFNPYDILAMADKMSWALENRDSLLKLELKTLEKMKARTWEDVAEDYINLFLETHAQERKKDVGDD